MFRKALLWITGVVLIFTAFVGAGMAVAGIAGLGRINAAVIVAAQATAGQLQRTLTATMDGLVTVEASLDAGRGIVSTLETTLAATTNAVSSSVPMLDQVGQVVGKDVVTIVTTVEGSLASAQSSAAGIDSFMQALATVPLLNLGSIMPAKPLGESINEIVTSLAPLPGELIEVQKGLQTAKESAIDIQISLRTVSTAVGRIDGALVSARTVTRQYMAIVSDAKRQVAGIVEGLPRLLAVVQIVLTIGLAWFGIAQLGLFTQGLELIARAWPLPNHIADLPISND